MSSKARGILKCGRSVPFPLSPGVALARGLEAAGAASRLTILILAGAGLGDAAAEALGRALAAQGPGGALRILDLVENQISGKGAIGIAEGLRVSKSLAILSLARNPIGPEGAAAIGAAISGTGSAASQLVHLNVSSCCIGDDGVAAMLQAGLRHNTSLTSLDIGANDLGDKGCMALALWAAARFFPSGEDAVAAAALGRPEPPRSGALPAEISARAKPLTVILNRVGEGLGNVLSAAAAASIREVKERVNNAADAAGWGRGAEGPALTLRL